MPETSHLEYYLKHSISPVNYNFSTLEDHFDRRSSLYHQLGLPPISFANAKVLEVAPGSGLNSLYIAATKPKSLDLVEPNPTGVKDIKCLYEKTTIDKTLPTIHEVKLENYQTESKFDVVICENWLGHQQHELKLMEKVGDLVSHNGTVVLTFTPISGFSPNIIRKLLANKIIKTQDTFEQKTDLLLNAFSPHLETMHGMTRSHKDWVHDCLLNPHYLNVYLSLENIIEILGHKMQIMSTCPRFTSDWRWFKGLFGEQKDFNKNHLKTLDQNILNFIDYRYEFSLCTESLLKPLNKSFNELLEKSLIAEKKMQVEGNLDFSDVAKIVFNIHQHLMQKAPELSHGFLEASNLLAKNDLVWRDVAAMKSFNQIFGRETVYVSLNKQVGMKT